MIQIEFKDIYKHRHKWMYIKRAFSRAGIYMVGYIKWYGAYGSYEL